ncbi:MAG: response regulator [Oscillatoriophycideae cyanobacterium NC_groundwater_1537_Pr4_S-0.65um_50_18]|nr:response regulator [Oscillatoriophycideae cyanobacterium NC_groundwater_1537_Pr4_S-0.65um_50_18]
MKILLVEDDEVLTELLTQTLTEKMYLVETTADGQIGWELLEAFQYDLILLDVMLPQIDGIRFCQKLRDRKDFTPVILITSQDSAMHKVAGLDAGADDYLVKPFNVDELLARMRALLRRESSDRSSILAWEGLQLNLSSCIVTYNGQPLNLTGKEYRLLELFLRNQQRIFSQSALINHLWALEEAPTENGVRAHVKALRRKLKQAGCEELIETIYGLGYRLKVSQPPEADCLKPESFKPEFPQPGSRDEPLPAQRSGGSGQGITQSGLSIPPELVEAWERYRGEYRDRLRVIQQAITALAEGNLNASLRQQACREAHTLAGSLGSFELHGLSQACRQIEAVLANIPDSSGLPSSETAALFEQITAIEFTLNIQSTFPPFPSRSLTAQQQRILVVGNTASFGPQLCDNAIAQTWQISILSPADAIAAISQARPNVVLLDLSVVEVAASGFELMEALAKIQPPVPVVVLTEQDNFGERLRIARLGGHTVLQTPVTPQRILSAIAQALQNSAPLEGKVLVVDDDSIILDQLSTILQPWGFQVELVNHPSRFWPVLEQTKPDLVILDLVMPELSGLDLCQVVRNDPRWEDLPVLFLSVNIDADLIYQVFRAGANDYVRKPIIEPELVARIINQLKRNKPRS